MSTMTRRLSLVTTAQAASLLLLFGAVTSCIFSPGSIGQNQSLPFETQKPIFTLAPDHVRELAIEKNDAVSGDRWSITVRPNPTGWEISSAGSRSIVDRSADPSFILHFLDTLNTLVYAEPAPQGPAASYGLEPPQFAIRATIASDDSTGADRVIELLIGTAARGTDSEEQFTRFARVPAYAQTMIIHGAAIQMLQMMTGFDSLRKKTVLTFSSDDVDELILNQGSPESAKEKLYTQRDGDSWTDRKHQPSKLGVRDRLDGLTHLRVREFVDDSERASKLAASTEASQLYELTLKGRALPKPVVLKIASLGPDLVATVSNRPGAAFLLYPESLRLFTDLVPLKSSGAPKGSPRGVQ